jgi:hypothetical protein
VFYWNFQNSTCGGQDAPTNQTQTGTTLLARDASSDFCLVRMNQTPVAHDPGAYFAGWNASGATPQSGAVFHHPSGDAKKLAIVSSPATRTQGQFEGSLTQFWQVSYSQGTTEQGSSGSGLFDQNHEVVGVLSEGSAACSITDPTQNNTGPPENGVDNYGRLEVAWDTKSDQSQQLKAWLDPGNTGALSLAGRDPTANHNPTAANDSATVAENSSETLIDVLVNDSDVDGDTLNITALGPTNHAGIVAIRNSGTRVGYTPAANFSGTETFTYTISDGHGGTAMATVTVTVTAASPPPSGGGGGGALAPSVLALLMAAAARRRYRATRS